MNPLEGFEIINHETEKSWLACRGRTCYWTWQMNKVMTLELLLWHAAKHRSECDRQIAPRPTLPRLPFEIINLKEPT